MLDKNIYIGRRAKLLEALKGEKGIAVFVGNADSPAQYRDNSYKWRQDSTWLYLFGIDEPLWAATIDLESGEVTAYADDSDINDIIWCGPTPSVRERAASSGISSTKPYAALEGDVRGRQIHFVPASRYYNAVKLAQLTGLQPFETMSSSKAGCPNASMPLVKAIIAQRLIKSSEEIALIDAACILGQEMHTVARNGIRVGRIEQEIVAEMEKVAIEKGWGLSFATILTQHGEVFHNHSHQCEIRPGKLLLVDAGVESVDNYASDFTRTYPSGGRFTSRQRDIYDIVHACNEMAFEMVRPGVRYIDVHMAVERRILSGLMDLGLVSGDLDEMVSAGTAGLFMPHGLGHNMGLDVHDMEDYGENLVGYDSDQQRSALLGRASLRMARTLVPGNVFTDEPGIYFIPDLIEIWKKEGRPFINFDRLTDYYDFGGIRLEDDILVTEAGARRLGGERLPIASADIEEAMN